MKRKIYFTRVWCDANGNSGSCIVAEDFHKVLKEFKILQKKENKNGK